jgi:hypothetical protein
MLRALAFKNSHHKKPWLFGLRCGWKCVAELELDNQILQHTFSAALFRILSRLFQERKKDVVYEMYKRSPGQLHDSFARVDVTTSMSRDCSIPKIHQKDLMSCNATATSSMVFSPR